MFRRFFAARRLASAAAVAVVAGTPSFADSRSFAVDDFDEVRLAGDARLKVTQGDGEFLTATGRARALERLEVDVEDGRLTIRTKGPGSVDFDLGVIDLTSLKVAGDVIVTMGPLTTHELSLAASGDAEFEIEGLEADELVVRNAGDTRFDLAGDVRRQVVSISGDGNYDALDLATRESEVRVSGDGDVEVHVQDQLTVSISGDGRVRYRGKPRVSQRVSGDGYIRQVSD